MVHHTLNLMLLKIFRLGQQHSLSFHHEWIGMGLQGPVTSYMSPVQSDPMISISRNPHSDIQRFYQDFRLPNYSLDTFSERLFDVVSNTTFATGNVQTELQHAITRLIVSAYVF